MALLQHCSVSVISAVRLSFSSSASPPLTTRASLNFDQEKKSHSRRMICRAMVQEAAAQGIPSVYAREMERLSAKESLILAVKSLPLPSLDLRFQYLQLKVASFSSNSFISSVSRITTVKLFSDYSLCSSSVQWCWRIWGFSYREDHWSTKDWCEWEDNYTRAA